MCGYVERSEYKKGFIMENLREYEVRLLKSGDVFQVIPVIVESEVTARRKASMLCSQVNADGFEILPLKAKCMSH